MHGIDDRQLESIFLNADSKPARVMTKRTSLKTLCTWPGALTLARDRAIKYQSLSSKDLFERYDSNRLLKATPFACKILEWRNKSTVCPLNPWLVTILSLVRGMYQFTGIRINLKFEIKVLCKALNVDLDK